LASESVDFAPVRLSLDDFPARDRLAVFREVIGRQIVRWDLTPLPDAPVAADLSWRALPGIEIVSGRLGATVIRRTPEFVADGNDGLGFLISTGGQARVTARGRELDETVSAGLMSFADLISVSTPESSHFLLVQIPRARLAALVANVDDAVLRPVPKTSAPLRLLRGYLGVLEGEGALATPRLRDSVVSHILDLVALTVGATRDGEALARGRGLAAARLQAMKDDVSANLTRHDLTVDFIAARHRISPRHVQRMFGDEGVTYSAFVLAQRLVRAHAMLSDPGLIGSRVAGIAFECGFGDLSHFNRMFRRQYGVTPSDVRAAAFAGS
jgi:AraC-like DNA-binding protein